MLHLQMNILMQTQTQSCNFKFKKNLNNLLFLTCYFLDFVIDFFTLIQMQIFTLKKECWKLKLLEITILILLFDQTTKLNFRISRNSILDIQLLVVYL